MYKLLRASATYSLWIRSDTMINKLVSKRRWSYITTLNSTRSCSRSIPVFSQGHFFLQLHLAHLADFIFLVFAPLHPWYRLFTIHNLLISSLINLRSYSRERRSFISPSSFALDGVSFPLPILLNVDVTKFTRTHCWPRWTQGEWFAAQMVSKAPTIMSLCLCAISLRRQELDLEYVLFLF